MTESGYWSEDFDTERDATDPAAAWHEYLHTKQGSVSLRFGRDTDFRSTAFAQRAGRFQVVKFTNSALDYRRSRRDVNQDGDDSYRLLISLKGQFKASRRDARDRLRPGEAVFFRWGDPFWVANDEPSTALILTVPEELIDPDRVRAASVRLDTSRALVRTLIGHVNELNSTREGWNADDFRVAYSAVVQELNWALAPPGPITPDEPKRVDYVRRLMNEHASDLSVTPESIAELCGGVTIRTLQNWLKEEGLSPGQMLRDIRLEQAHHRLAQPVDLDTIASLAGFSTTRRFVDAYQRRYGMTPSEMRRKLAAEETRALPLKLSDQE
ncbi:AraC family transcriptional regulator [Nocardia carnea]|uniref:AraC family transcriptional regulator n=1 Tax=Nocardia carnea TaxID=37328 RepID=UPI0003011839|nr:AraC family transcriptional regulator [Nocardia carnea]